ncbi:MAG: O-antigen ligase family protein [bacterium]|nr:O-antigen ligase family protein [bacterium]
MQLTKSLTARLKSLYVFPVVLFLLPFYAGKPYFPGVTSAVPVTLFAGLFTGIYVYYALKRKSFFVYQGVPSLLLVVTYLAASFLSANLFQSRQAIHLLLAGMAAFQVAAMLSADKSARRQLLEAVGYSASFLSVYAALFASSVGMTSGLYATFYNYNAFAGYLALSVLALPGLAFSTRDSESDTGLFYPMLGFFVVYLVWIQSMDYNDCAVWALLIGSTAVLAYILLRRVSPRVRYLLFFIPVPVALAMTGSRGGLLAFIAAVILALTIVILREPSLRKFAVWFAAVTTVLIAVIISTQAGLIERFSLLFHPTNRSDLFRMLVWKGTWKAFTVKPLLGHGPGTFSSFYPVYKAGGADTLMAHNSYIQLLAETGAMGILTWIAFVFASLSGLRTRWAGWPTLITAALLAGIAAMIVHNAVDYTWYIPAHQIAFMAILGCLAAFKPETNNQQPTTNNRARRAQSLNRIPRVVIPLLMVVSALAALIWSMPAAVNYDKGMSDLGNGWRSYAETEIARAATADPWSGKYIAALADVYSSDADGGRDAGKLYLRAIALERLNPYYRLRLAEHLLRKGEYGKAAAIAGEAAELSPNLRAAWRLIGDAGLAEKRYRDAERAYLKVLRIGTAPYENEKYLPLGELLPRAEEGRAWLGLARIYALQGRQTEFRAALTNSRRIFTRYIESVENNPLLADKKPEMERYENLIRSIDDGLIKGEL